MSASAEARKMREMRINHVMRLIVQAAANDQECPTNSVLRERVGVKSNATVSVMISELEERGLLAVTRMSDARVVQIVATGKQTATPFLWRTTGDSLRNMSNGQIGKRAPNQVKADIFDDVLADTGDIKAAGAAIGVNRAAAMTRFARIRRQLGSQAV
jgi:hypothetical protein